MIFNRLDYTIEKTLQQQQTAEQEFLGKFTGEKFTAAEAKHLFEKISDHKWYVSERLQRDIGLTVAAVDYFENFHESRRAASSRRKLSKAAMKAYEEIMLTI